MIWKPHGSCDQLELDLTLSNVTVATDEATYGVRLSDVQHAKALVDSRPPAPRLIDRLTSEQRKQFPMCSGFIDYFPDAMAAVSHISWLGNEKHNPGQPLHHARGKSMDHADCIARHVSTRHNPDPAYHDDVLAPVFHRAEAAWRAMADLQQAMEVAYGLPLPPSAK